MTERVEITLLGGLEVRLDGRSIRECDWSGRRPMELVALLALSPSRSLLREQVIEALWPHLDPDAGAANLRKAAHHARRVLGDPDAVSLRSGQVHLFVHAQVSTDLHRFHSAALPALQSRDPVACLSAADLVGGELLPGLLYEEWTTDDRRQVSSMLTSLLRTAGAWERLVALDPTDELAHQELMRAALAAGGRAAVIARFEQLRRTLATEFGVAPSSASIAIHQEALAGLADGSGGDLVGRDREVSLVEAMLRTDRRHTLVAVHGPAGIGKSAFCRRLGTSLERDGWIVRWADAAGRDQPFGPLVDVVEEVVLGPGDVLAGVPEQVRSVLASLSDVVSDGPPLSGPLTRHQVLGAITRVLRCAAGGQPTVLVLDDAHEADQATVDALLHVATSVRDMLVVLAFRSESAGDQLQDLLDRLARAGRLVDVGLTGIDPTSAAELVKRSATIPLGEDDVALLVQRAAGNPFAITELAGTAQPGGDLAASTAAAITSRLVGLDGDTAAALGRLALGREELDRSLVLALTGWDEADAFELLDRALESGVLVVAGSRYRFRHDLVRDALRAQVPPHRRLIVHREAAARLAEHGVPAAVVAHHWLEADEPAEGARWSLAAAAEAMRVGAYRDARRHLSSVLRHDPDHPTALRLDAESLDMLGDPSALAAYDAAIAATADDLADDLVIARALAQIKQGDPAGGLAAVRGAVPRSMMGRLNEALTYAGAAALGVTDPAIGTQKADEVRRLAMESGDRAGIVIAAWAHAAAAHARGDLHDSVLGDLRDTRDLPHLAVRVFDGHLCMTQRFLYGWRPYPEVIRFAEALTSEAERLGALRGRAFGITLRAEAMFHAGQLDEARRGFADGLRLHRETGGPTGEAHALQRLAELQHADGLQADARHTIDEALDVARVSDIGFHLLDRIYGSRITISTDGEEALGAVEESEAAVRGPLETCPGCRIHLAVPAAIAAARAGDLERAHSYADSVDYLADVVMRLPAWYAARDEVQAQLALASGDAERARQAFTAAAQRYAGAGHPLDEERCLAVVV